MSKYVKEVNAVFKALNDSTRRKILDLLKDKDLNAGDIAMHFDISKPSISHHLDLLKQADLVTATKNGQFVEYAINTTVMDNLIAWMMQLKT